MLLQELIFEKKEEKEKKIVFVETDPQEPFPKDTVSALEKQVKKLAKDLTKSWKSSIEVVDTAFDELEVPKPQAHLKNRWNQYLELLKTAVDSLADARGFKSDWSTI